MTGNRGGSGAVINVHPERRVKGKVENDYYEIAKQPFMLSLVISSIVLMVTLGAQKI